MSLEKVQPPDMADGVTGRPVAGLGSAVILGALFAALVVLVVVSGRAPLRFSLGDVATEDVRARVAFEYEDEEKTREARARAREATPSIYMVDDAALWDARTALVGLLDEIAAASTTKERLEEIRKQLPIKSAAELATLRTEPGKSKVRTQLEMLFAEFRTCGIMTVQQRAAEGADGTLTGMPVTGAAARTFTLKTVTDVQTAQQRIDEALDAKALLGLKETSGALRAWLKKRIRPTLAYDASATRMAKDAAEKTVLPQIVRKGPNERLVSVHNRIGPREYDMLIAEQTAFLDAQSTVDRWKRIGGVAALVVVSFLLGGLYLRHYRPRVFQSKIRLAVLGLLTVLIVLVARLLLYVRWLPHPQYLVPVAFASMILSLAYDRKFSCAMTLFIVLMVGLATEADFRPLLVLLAGGLVASLYTVNIRKRTKLLKVGVLVGLAHVAMIAGVALGRLHDPRVLIEQAAVGMINGIGVGFIITGLMPFFEPLFRITTDISLLELGDLNQPVLKSFALRAPGSYNHSLTVGVLAEAAARAIGADDLLTRVGSYFHDIGKINKPHYFVENQGDQESRHDRLSPQMSALVITAHTKDGLELGRELGLPRRILDIIAQHHGSTLVEYFYKRAQEDVGPDEVVDEHLFRYPGPTPRSGEAAIVMLADSVESASRVLSDPTPARIRSLIHQIIENKLRDGQLQECNLTLRELHGIENSLAKGLISVFHGRIKY